MPINPKSFGLVRVGANKLAVAWHEAAATNRREASAWVPEDPSRAEPSGRAAQRGATLRDNVAEATCGVTKTKNFE